MFKATIVFWGLIALAAERPGDPQQEVRAIFLPAHDHTPTLRIDSKGFDHMASRKPDFWSKKKKFAFWKLGTEEITFDATPSPIGFPVALSSAMIDPQGAHPATPPMEDSGWNYLPALRLTAGSFSTNGFTKAKGGNQRYRYEAVVGSVKKASSKSPHEAVRSFALTTTLSRIQFKDATGQVTGTIVLKQGADISFSNTTNATTFDPEHYRAYWKTLFPSTADQYLPFEELPPPIGTLTTKQPDRCPPPIARKAYQ